ncbi:MAG: hypothetical protein DI587_03320 [Variovorax paradoxus]|nr:MAG: hypothetical protein DI583_03320 [Variovorax paradoxus]PZQ15728.1 MAG: hypothetical protein DI587_03320 [Variovorax paradoxus]
MLATVYRCRHQGHKLDPETIKAAPVRGDLIVRRLGYFERVALLTPPEGRNVIPVMGKVKILELDGRGVLLAGLEMLPGQGKYGNGPTYPQTWWCVLGPQEGTGKPGPTWEEREALARTRDAYEIGRTMTRGRERSGF